MRQDDYTAQVALVLPESGTVAWDSPSNIALVKYWGKKPVQLPANASISFTLKNCYTATKLSFSRAEKRSVKVFVNGQEQSSFLKRLKFSSSALKTIVHMSRITHLKLKLKILFRIVVVLHLRHQVLVRLHYVY